MNDFLIAWNKSYVDPHPQMRDIGARITAVGQSSGTMMMPARPDWLGDPIRGLLHPGALTVLADSACGLAVGAALDRSVTYATLDLRMEYLGPASPDLDVYCVADCYRLTRSVAFTHGHLWQSKSDAPPDRPNHNEPDRVEPNRYEPNRGEPIASVQATFMLSTVAKAGANVGGHTSAAPALDAAWQPPVASEPVLAANPIPYVEYLGIRVAPDARQPIFRMPYQEKLIGNPTLPALHGGVVAGFAETAATLHLIQTLNGAKFPKSIDFSIDYLRSARPEETFAKCEVVRVGARVALVNVRCWQKTPDYPIVVARALFLLTPA